MTEKDKKNDANLKVTEDKENDLSKSDKKNESKEV